MPFTTVFLRLHLMSLNTSPIPIAKHLGGANRNVSTLLLIGGRIQVNGRNNGE